MTNAKSVSNNNLRYWESRLSHRLANRILSLPHDKNSRVDFLRQVCSLLMSGTDSASVELWVEEDGACARCRSQRRPLETFEFTLVPCHRRVDGGSEEECEGLLCELLEQTAKGDGESGLVTGFSGGLSEFRPVLSSRPETLDEEVASAVLLPLTMGNEITGWLRLSSREELSFSEEDLAALDHLAQSCAIALVSQRAQAALRERVKELTGLYELARLSERPRISLEQLLQGIAGLLPRAWQYPEIAVGRIVLDGRDFYSTEDKGGGTSRQQSSIVVGGSDRGFVEVIYREKRSELDEGPFLKEERSLLDAIAREVAVIIERREAASERERLQEQLFHADRLATIGELAAGVAHELNEPLGAVLGFAQLARKHVGLPSPADEDVRKIEAAALQAREIVRKLMVFARQTPPRTAHVNLNRLVDDGLYLLEARCAEKRIEVERRLGEGLPDIVADPSQLKQVLVNLVVNAIQAMPDGGRLTIATRHRESRVILRIVDTGLGMTREVRQRIFLPFFTTKEIDEGTGLGLAVAHGIVSAHGGRIGVESQPGQGSCFEVEIPVNGKDDEEIACG
jgi:signal transduction histidine kinase